MAQERLQKLLARAGVSSRRRAEQLITSGRVRVDGRIVTELGSKADERAKIEVDGQQVSSEQLCYGILHKPRQMMTTLSDPEGRPTVAEILRRVGVRVVPVGRLDFNTSGALLFTNDGDFAQALGHPKTSVPKVYVAKVRGELEEKDLARFRDSIDIDGKKTRPAEVRLLRRESGNTWLEITLSEGRNRQIRRLGEHAHATVSRLARLSHAGISTEGVRLGEYRLLTVDELKELKAKYGVPKKLRGVVTDPEAFESRPKKKSFTGTAPGAKRSFVRKTSASDEVDGPRPKRRGPPGPPPATDERPFGGRAKRGGGPAPGRPSGERRPSTRGEEPRSFEGRGTSKSPSARRPSADAGRGSRVASGVAEPARGRSRASSGEARPSTRPKTSESKGKTSSRVRERGSSPRRGTRS